MRMLAGLILPTSGRIAINGVPVSSATADGARRAIGLLTEAPGLWERLTVRIEPADVRAPAWPRGSGASGGEAALDLVELSDRAGDLAGKLSKGLKQRLAIARALIHRPPVVLLDEPTSGLDPASARHIRDLILKLRQDQRAVLVSTHNLAEAEELSDRIAVLKTRLLALDAPATLRKAMSGAKVNIDVEGDASRWAAAAIAFGDAVAVGSRLSVTVPDLSVVPDLGRGPRVGRRTSRPRAAGSTHARRGLSRAGRSRAMTRATGSSWQRVSALARKDAAELARNPGAILPAVMMVVGSLVPAFFVVVGAPMIAGRTPRRVGTVQRRSASRGRPDSRAGRVERQRPDPGLPVSPVHVVTPAGPRRRRDGARDAFGDRGEAIEGARAAAGHAAVDGGAARRQDADPVRVRAGAVVGWRPRCSSPACGWSANPESGARCSGCARS